MYLSEITLYLADTMEPIPAEAISALEKLIGWLLWLVCAAGVLRLMWIGAQVGHDRNHPSSDPPDSPLGVFVGLIVASSASGIAAALLTFG